MDEQQMKIIEMAVAGILPLVGVWIGAYLGSRGERSQRRLDFLERRLNEFYAPMLAMLTDIRVNSSLRETIRDAGDRGWQALMAKRSDGPGSSTSSLTRDEFEPYRKLLEYDDKKFEKESLPGYREMVSLFRDKMSLAFTDTAKHFPTFVEYVSVWERFTAGAIPPDAVAALNHSERNCHPFYENLVIRHNELVKQISEGKPR